MKLQEKLALNSPQENKRLVAALYREFMATATVLLRQIDAETIESYECRSKAASTIIDIVCDEFQVQRSLIHTKLRTALVAIARQVAMFLIRKNTNLTSIEIGDIFDRDSSTVFHAIDNVQRRMETEPKFAAKMAVVSARCAQAIANA